MAVSFQAGPFERSFAIMTKPLSEDTAAESIVLIGSKNGWAREKRERAKNIFSFVQNIFLP